jgi:hypothetical protein
MTLTQQINKARELARLRREARSLVIRNRREPSLNEQNAVYHPQGYGLFFCPHDKHYFSACTTCKRTHADGSKNMQKFLEKHS